MTEPRFGCLRKPGVNGCSWSSADVSSASALQFQFQLDYCTFYRRPPKAPLAGSNLTRSDVPFWCSFRIVHFVVLGFDSILAMEALLWFSQETLLSILSTVSVSTELWSPGSYHDCIFQTLRYAGRSSWRKRSGMYPGILRPTVSIWSSFSQSRSGCQSRSK